MLETVSRIEGKSIELPAVVTSLFQLHTLHATDPTASVELENGHIADSAREVLVSYGFDPEQERSRQLAYATRLVALAYKFGGRAVRALDETMLYQATGLYERGELNEMAAVTLFPDNADELENSRHEKALIQNVLSELRMGEALVTLGDFLLKYMNDVQELDETILQDAGLPE